MTSNLTETEQQILAFEGRWYRHGGAKDEAITVELGLTPTRYYQLLLGVDGIIDNPAALEHAPTLVNRLRRLRQQRRHSRSA